jgi:hypothetical protein
MSARQKRCDASPGPIRDDEDVAYGLYSPELFDVTTRRLRPEAINISHLLGRPHIDECGHSTGVSVSRTLTPKSLDELRRILETIVRRNPERQVEGYATASVDEILKIRSGDGQAALHILDDGRIDYPDHAVVRGAASLSRGALRGPRNDLVELFNANLILDGD